MNKNPKTYIFLGMALHSMGLFLLYLIAAAINSKKLEDMLNSGGHYLLTAVIFIIISFLYS